MVKVAGLAAYSNYLKKFKEFETLKIYDIILGWDVFEIRCPRGLWTRIYKGIEVQ